jgi:hypothetical protein
MSPTRRAQIAPPLRVVTPSRPLDAPRPLAGLDLLHALRDLPQLADLTSTDKLVLFAIALRMNADETGGASMAIRWSTDAAHEAGVCWPSNACIARDTWLTDRAVRRSTGRLAAAGVIAIGERFEAGSNERTSNAFRVLQVGNHGPHVGNLSPHLDAGAETGGGEPRSPRGEPKSPRVGNHGPQGGEPRSMEEITEEITGRKERERPLAPPGGAKGKKLERQAHGERAVQLDEPLSDELRHAAATLRVGDIDAAWLKFCGRHVGKIVHVAGCWQGWCVTWAKNERTERERRPKVRAQHDRGPRAWSVGKAGA